VLHEGRLPRQRRPGQDSAQFLGGVGAAGGQSGTDAPSGQDRRGLGTAHRHGNGPKDLDIGVFQPERHGLVAQALGPDAGLEHRKIGLVLAEEPERRGDLARGGLHFDNRGDADGLAAPAGHEIGQDAGEAGLKDKDALPAEPIVARPCFLSCHVGHRRSLPPPGNSQRPFASTPRQRQRSASSGWPCDGAWVLDGAMGRKRGCGGSLAACADPGCRLLVPPPRTDAVNVVHQRIRIHLIADCTESGPICQGEAFASRRRGYRGLQSVGGAPADRKTERLSGRHGRIRRVEVSRWRRPWINCSRRTGSI
jgi:hypothetical protein